MLLMSPMDRGERAASGQIVTLPTMPRLVEIQENRGAKPAAPSSIPFEAMGGEAPWRAGMRPAAAGSADFIHPPPAGAKKVGVLLDQALEAGFRQFKAKTQRLADRAPGRGAKQ